MRQSIHDEVMKLTSRLAQRCHPRVAEQYAAELARYARLDTACDAFNAFTGCRPADDADLFDSLAQRRRCIADLLAGANLDAFEQEKTDGVFLAIPFFGWCSDKQPVFLVNRTSQAVTYMRRRLYAFASADDGIDEYRTAGSAFADGIAAGAVIQPGERLQIDDYSMSYDGDFVSIRRVVLIIEGERAEWFVSVSKLAGFLWDEDLHGFHELKRIQDT
ncbi:hypothetical protein [Aquipseudomonas campi]|nr:hypothetical protein [Pseudomonas campi]